MAIGKLIKGALRKAYQRNTAPLQAANRVARTIAPNSKIAGAIAAAASPGILNSGPSKKSTAPKKPKKETTDPTRKASTKKIKGRSAKGKVGKTTQRNRAGHTCSIFVVGWVCGAQLHQAKFHIGLLGGSQDAECR